MALVIGIAGVPGSGKTSVALALARLLGDAAFVPMDAYEQMTRMDMRELAAWSARGADFDALPIPLLDEHLAALKAGKSVTEPATGRRITPASSIVLETQFGRAHAASGRHIDLLAWVDTPPDVALARTVRRVAGEMLGADEEGMRRRAQWLAGYLDHYAGLVHRLVALQRDRAGADILLDGQLGPDLLAAQVQAELVRRRQAGA